MREPLIIEAAINGGTPKSRNRHVPRTIDEVIASAAACAETGATIASREGRGIRAAKDWP